MQSLMMLGGMGIICWILIRGRLRRGRAQAQLVIPPLSHNANATSRPQSFTGTQSLGAPPEVLRWQVELHDLGRELKGELDSKMLAVRALTKSFDQAAHRLSEMIRMAEQLQCAEASPLAHIRQLSQQGWSDEKIAAHLGRDVEDVRCLKARRSIVEGTSEESRGPESTG